MIYIGIDNSIVSPGLTIYSDGNNKWYFYFYQQRKRELDISEHTNTYYIEALEYPDWKTREERIEKVTNGLITKIGRHMCEDDYRIAIEGYSFGSQSRSVTNLAECGGVLRNKIHKNGWVYEELPPSHIKKYFTGKGNANKYSLYLQFKEENIIDLYDVCNFPESKNDNIPSPINDLVDSTAIVYLLRGLQPKKIDIVGSIINSLKKD